MPFPGFVAYANAVSRVLDVTMGIHWVNVKNIVRIIWKTRRQKKLCYVSESMLKAAFLTMEYRDFAGWPPSGQAKVLGWELGHGQNRANCDSSGGLSMTLGADAVCI
eukprot:scaffold107138_cov38-Cyclotella_meneghiniana.AAC.5